MILLDTNLLGRMTDSADPQCAVARKAIHDLLSKRERLIVVPQNLYEFWTVATRKPRPASRRTERTWDEGRASEPVVAFLPAAIHIAPRSRGTPGAMARVGEGFGNQGREIARRTARRSNAELWDHAASDF